MGVNITKSIKLARKDAIGLADIMDKDPRFEGPSEALRYCIEDAARDEPNWNEVAEKAKKLDYDDMKISDSDVGVIRTFVIDDETYLKVHNSVKEQFRMERPQVSFIIRLCIYAARLKLHTQLPKETLEVIEINAADLMEKAVIKTHSLIKNNRIHEIQKYLEL